MSKNDIHRDNSRRQHRSVALYLVVQCWLRGTQKIRIKKKELRELLNLARIEEERENWIKEDFGEFFFYIENEYVQYTQEPCYIFSRSKGKDKILDYEEASSEFELQKMFNDTSLNAQESYVSFYLSLLSQGIISPKSMSIKE
nr:hypothetical protein [Pyrinomonadaceae bacterium]